MSLKLVLVLCLSALTSAAQAADRRDPHLIVDLSQLASLHAWLSVTEPVPDDLGQAFTNFMGCPADALRVMSRNAGIRLDRFNLEVSCPLVIKPAGLRGTVHWDLTALNAALIRAGDAGISIDVAATPSSSLKFLRDGMPPESLDGAQVFHRNFRLGEFSYIEFDVGSQRPAAWLLGTSGSVFLLLPLLLYAARRGGLLTAMAAANGLFWLGITVWLFAVMNTGLPFVMAFPWNLAVIFLPMLAAVWAGSRIADGPRWRAHFWRGVRAAALLAGYVGVVSISPAKLWWAGCCAVVIAISSWAYRRASGYRFEPVIGGELLTRVHELAGRAGTKVTSVQLLLGGDDLPMAYASGGGIFISRGPGSISAEIYSSVLYAMSTPAFRAGGAPSR